MKFFLLLATLCTLSLASVWAQNPHYNDFLSSDFHKERRAVLRSKMPANSVAVFFSNAVRNRSNDVDYIYHQDPDFYYLTGHNEPHAVLIITKEAIDYGQGKVNEIIFIRSRNALAELYDGGRTSTQEAMEELGLQMALEGAEFAQKAPDFTQFDKVMFFEFEDDVRNLNEEGDLYDLIQTFKEKVGYKTNDLSIEPKNTRIDHATLPKIMDEMRGIKTKEEVSLLRKAVDISALAQAEVMKAIRPGMSETEVQGMHEYIYKKYRAEYEGYPSIVGAGHNGCVLHYIENYKPEIKSDELILMDLGAEYHGYTADVTRTIPVSGTFSKEQKQIYDLVYKAQEAAMAICKPGTTFSELYEATSKVINEGLVELGIYKSLDKKDIINPETGRNRYYPHGCCHHIGLDVHDRGEYKKLEENMIITIEPGIYITEGSPTEERWWNIPVRIEDDFLITKDGCELLSDKAPRTSEAIEALMAQPSAFDAISLPELEEK
ncbi:aminopeptidase P N-terminal domain-containing protein [Cytophagales bacterium LB-30]|uniref:Xaa-Pro aminopeptidase n=1 Tax=Shiella aurantiaca TaxID=3058365 RepID=A0ABT8F1I7_9BACT|nr:aminopeptidase P N-terminal domain-containing protein [Shiella aurantiaca]MDN4164317.1 aminopeptidase P N-terminal domain-containing protein [Shiella aurantiaca]